MSVVSYVETIARAVAAEREHWVERSRRVRAWYEQHPDMLHVIVGEDERGNLLRHPTKQRDIVQLCMPWWLDYCEELAREKEPVYWQVPNECGGTQVVELETFLRDWNARLAREQRQLRAQARQSYRQLTLVAV